MMSRYFCALIAYLSFLAVSKADVKIEVNGLRVSIQNDFVTLNFQENAQISTIYVNGKELVNGQRAFYLDWKTDDYQTFLPGSVNILEQTASRVHFYWLQEKRLGASDIELHYIMENALSGIYSYVKYTNNRDTNITFEETKMVFGFNDAIFTEGTNQGRTGRIPNCAQLADSRLVQEGTYLLEDGTYYSKYDYATYIRETDYHGFYGNGYGAFIISASKEYHGGDPMKQDLTVHDCAMVTNYFVSKNFGSPALSAPPGWTHIYGPFLIYFSTGSNVKIVQEVKIQAAFEKYLWPYDFVDDPEYPLVRGTVSGVVTGQTRAQIVVYDSLGEVHDTQQLGYVFSSKTDSQGHFVITKVRPGSYRLVAYPLAGNGGENSYETLITVHEGTDTSVNVNLPEPGKIIWSLGQVNRRSSEFKYSNQQRNYAWHLLPPKTLNFTIGESTASEDWYYAQSTLGSNWNIKYNDTNDGFRRTLRISLASTTDVNHLVVTLNNNQIAEWYDADDESITRSAMQSGRYSFHQVNILPEYVDDDENVLSLWAKRGLIMYDAISLQKSNF